MPEGDTVYDYCWFPKMSSLDPDTCLWVNVFICQLCSRKAWGTVCIMLSEAEDNGQGALSGIDLDWFLFHKHRHDRVYLLLADVVSFPLKIYFFNDEIQLYLSLSASVPASLSAWDLFVCTLSFITYINTGLCTRKISTFRQSMSAIFPSTTPLDCKQSYIV